MPSTTLLNSIQRSKPTLTLHSDIKVFCTASSIERTPKKKIDKARCSKGDLRSAPPLIGCRFMTDDCLRGHDPKC